MIAWIVLVLAVAVSLILGIEALIRRLGVRRANPSSAPGGIADLVRFLRDRRR